VTHVLEVRRGGVHSWSIEPADYGITEVSVSDLAGGDPGENATVIEGVLRGQGSAGARAAVLLNAAAAVYVSRDQGSYDDAVRETRAAMSAGVGVDALERLRAASHAPRTAPGTRQ